MNRSFGATAQSIVRLFSLSTAYPFVRGPGHAPTPLQETQSSGSIWNECTPTKLSLGCGCLPCWAESEVEPGALCGQKPFPVSVPLCFRPGRFYCYVFTLTNLCFCGFSYVLNFIQQVLILDVVLFISRSFIFHYAQFSLNPCAFQHTYVLKQS